MYDVMQTLTNRHYSSCSADFRPYSYESASEQKMRKKTLFIDFLKFFVYLPYDAVIDPKT